MASSGRSTHGRGLGSGQSRVCVSGGTSSSSTSTPSDLVRYCAHGTMESHPLQYPPVYVPAHNIPFGQPSFIPPFEEGHQNVPVNEEAASERQSDPDQISLEDLLNRPGRKDHLPNLDPFTDENSIWFDRDDDGSLVRKISGILRSGFNGPWTSWTKTPPAAKDAYFVKFAQKFYWDPAITDLVRDEFNKVCIHRMKGIVTQIKRKGSCPGWLDGNIWLKLVEHWDTDAAKKRSATAAAARNSARDGLGPHKHVSGQKTYYRVKQDLAKELDRTPTLSEVFIKTHTTAAGTFVDYKAKGIVETFEQTLSDKLSQVDSNMSSDDAQANPLTATDMDQLFLQSTSKDNRGRPYGLGSLSRYYEPSTKTKSLPSSLSGFQQLEAYKREVEQYKEDTAREVETIKQNTAKEISFLREQNSALQMLLGYMKEKDPTFAAYLATNPPCPFPTDTAGPSGGSETQPPDTNDFVQDFDA